VSLRNQRLRTNRKNKKTKVGWSGRSKTRDHTAGNKGNQKPQVKSVVVVLEDRPGEKTGASNARGANKMDAQEPCTREQKRKKTKRDVKGRKTWPKNPKVKNTARYERKRGRVYQKQYGKNGGYAEFI